MKGPLDSVLVLDLSRVLAGPTATQILGDLGADVIKVERPGAGDDTRSWGPPFVQRGDDARESTYFLAANRNKRSIAIDIATPGGAALIREIAGKAKIVVENFKVGGLERYGLDYATLAAINPALVYCSVTGFGHTGPESMRAGYDFMIQATGGLMSITGEPDGAPGSQPMKVGVAVVDLFTGVYAATAMLAALREAEATGRGQHIDMALYDVQASMLANQASGFLATGEAPGRLGNAHPSLAPYDLLPTGSEPIVVAVGNDRQFAALCEALDVPTLAGDPRFALNAGRVANRTELLALLAAPLATRGAAEWCAMLDAAGVPCGPVRSIDQVFSDPQTDARQLVVEQSSGRQTGPVRSVASPIRLSQTPVTYRLPPPDLGEHTDTVLGEILDMDEGRIDLLRQAGVIG